MITQKVVLRFNAGIAEQPVVYHLIKDYNLQFNILKANVNPQKEGFLVLEISGDRCQEGLDFLRQLGVLVKPLESEVVRNDEKCIMCGACTGICPTGALYLQRPKMEVCFDPDKCIVCKLCVRICPLKAMELSF